MKTTELGLAGAGLVLSAFPVVAHHSFAMFDRSHTMTLEGTVREFQWSNPHASIMLAVTREGQSQLWVVEMMGPGGLARQGWTQNTLTPGMRVNDGTIAAYDDSTLHESRHTLPISTTFSDRRR